MSTNDTSRILLEGGVSPSPDNVLQSRSCLFNTAALSSAAACSSSPSSPSSSSSSNNAWKKTVSSHQAASSIHFECKDASHSSNASNVSSHSYYANEERYVSAPRRLLLDVVDVAAQQKEDRTVTLSHPSLHHENSAEEQQRVGGIGNFEKEQVLARPSRCNEEDRALTHNASSPSCNSITDSSVSTLLISNVRPGVSEDSTTSFCHSRNEETCASIGTTSLKDYKEEFDDDDNVYSTDDQHNAEGDFHQEHEPTHHECISYNHHQDHEYDKPTITIRFSDIIGHGAAKLRLDEMLIPLALPSCLASRILTGVRAVPASILLYGPPGCGKTKLAQAVAGEAQAAFLSIGPSDVLSKFVGESEASVKNLFEKAKSMAMRMESRCAVLFFDEIDALGMSRCGNGGSRWGGSDDSSSGNSSRRILAELLIQLTKLSDETGELEKKTQDDGMGLDNKVMSQGNEQRVEDCVDGPEENTLKYQRSEKNADSTSLCSNHYEGSPRPISPESMEDANHRQPIQDCNKPRSIGHQSSHSQPHTHDDTAEPDCPPRARIIVVAATNRPEDCDPALLRRFSIRVLVGLPSQRDRKKIIRRLLEGVENTLAPSQLKELATATEGWSGSDLESVTREAAMAPIRECLRAAAMLKMKVRNKRKFEQSQEQSEFSANMDVNDMARDKLLRGFMKLRPVNMKDFEEAITFWVGDDQEEMMPSMSKKSAVTHYDSESTSSSDVEPDIDEQLDD